MRTYEEYRNLAEEHLLDPFPEQDKEASPPTPDYASDPYCPYSAQAVFST